MKFKLFHRTAPFVVLSTLILLLAFQRNFYRSVNEGWFESFQKEAECLVIGRLSLAQRSSIFSKGGLTGMYNDTTLVTNAVVQQYINYYKNKKDIHKYQYQIYFEELDAKEKDFETYNSQIGGQAIMLSFLDKILPFTNYKKYKTYQFLTSFLTSIVFSLFLGWVLNSFGIFTYFITLLFMVLSPWLIVFGRNLWWSLWSFYLPFVLMLYLLKYEHNSNKILPFWLIHVLVLFAILLKCIITGYEYITSTLVMTITPMVFYSIIDKWRIRRIINRILCISSSSLLAIIISLITLAYQLSYILGNVKLGYIHIISSFFRRTYGNVHNFDISYKASLESNVIGVVRSYLNSLAFDFNYIFDFESKKRFLILSFTEIIIFLSLLSLIFMVITKWKNLLSFNNKTNIANANYFDNNKIRALIIMLWLSILAPISWYVIFKAHSFIHIHMNQIAMYMPYMLFGYILLGLALTSIVKYICIYLKRN